MFIHTGLLQKARTPEQVIGVIAHETGHIAGGHLSRLNQAMKSATAESIIGAILGTAAIIAGAGEAGSALILGGQEAAQRSLLSYSRAQEGSADGAAVKYLDSVGITSEGFLQFFKILKKNSYSSTSEQNPYTRSHPLTSERISFVENHVKASPFTGKRVPEALQHMHNRMRAKLDAYLYAPEHTFRIYPVADKSLLARYARAMAYHRSSQMDKAVAEIESLINEYPDDAYFAEFLGQIYFENGMAEKALPYYQKAVSEVPQSPLILRAAGRTYLEIGDPGALEQAISLLEQSLKYERDSAFTWRQLAIAYGKNGQTALADLALAEEAYLKRNYSEAIFLAGRAEKELKTGSKKWIEAQDLRLISERLLKKSNTR